LSEFIRPDPAVLRGRQAVAVTSRGQKIVIVLVVVGVCVLFVLGVLVGAGVTGWRAATRAGDEAATAQNLKTIQAVEVVYFNTHKRTFGTIDQLIAEQMLSSKFAGESHNRRWLCSYSVGYAEIRR
jgi:hypothetical protein